MSKRSVLFLVSSALTLLAVLGACTKDVGKPDTGPPPPGACDTITYEKNIKALLDLKCGSGSVLACHVAPNNSGGANFSTYLNAKNYANNGKINLRVFVQQNMPASPEPPLTKEQKDMLRCWLDNGAPE